MLLLLSQTSITCHTSASTVSCVHEEAGKRQTIVVVYDLQGKETSQNWAIEEEEQNWRVGLSCCGLASLYQHNGEVGKQRQYPPALLLIMLRYNLPQPLVLSACTLHQGLCEGLYKCCYQGVAKGHS